VADVRLFFCAEFGKRPSAAAFSGVARDDPSLVVVADEEALVLLVAVLDLIDLEVLRLSAGDGRDAGLE
jgi:hypothetical protein